MPFALIDYKKLNARQKENYNFFQAASILAQYGFNSIRLSDDWNGADFIAYHINGIDVFKVQLKGRFVVDKKYIDKGLHVCFMHKDFLCIYPHDELLKIAMKINNFSKKDGWIKNGIRSWRKPPEKIFNYMVDKNYLLKRKK